MYLALAWRNIWRNRRRTLITGASICIAVLLAMVMRSAQLGAYQRMIDNVVGFYTGHIQLHAKGYWDDQTLDNSFAPNDTITDILRKQESILHVVPRIESFALASNKDLTEGTLVIGIDPAAEDQLTHIAQKITAGHYLDENDAGVLIAEGLAERLLLQVGDTLVLLGQGYHGSTAAGQYRIQGIIHFPSPELNNGMMYLTLAQAQNFYGTGDRLTSLAIAIKSNADAVLVADQIREAAGALPFEVMDWKQMLPDMLQIIEVDNAGGMITISILYMIIAFGLFGTILMMLAERQHEFGILVAIGMKKLKLARVVTMEIIMLSGVGVIAGIALGIPVIFYFHLHPIQVTGELAHAYERFGMEPVFPFSNDLTIFLSQAAVVFVMSILLSLYPLFQIQKASTIAALKS
jgi:putative ABC transport system permease protein